MKRIILTVLVLSLVFLTFVNYDAIRSVGIEAASIEELAYDDGIRDMTSSHSAGKHLAVKFSLPSGWDDAKLLTARYYFTNSRDFFVHVIASDGVTELLQPLLFSPSMSGWVDVNVSEFDIKITSDFYISIEYDTDYNPVLGVDTSEPDGKSYSGDPGSWVQKTDRDYMIRAIISPYPAENGYMISTLLTDLEYPTALWVKGEKIFLTETVDRNTIYDGKLDLIQYNVKIGAKRELVDNPVNSDAVVVAGDGKIYLTSYHGSLPGEEGSVSVVDPSTNIETTLLDIEIASVDMFIDSNDDIYIIGSSDEGDAKSIYLLPAGDYANPIVLQHGLGRVKCISKKGSYIYYSDRTAIRRFNIAGGAIEKFSEKSVSSISFSSEYLYYADRGHGVIGRIDLATGSDETLISSLNNPLNVRFDQATKRLYFMEAGTDEEEYKDGTLKVYRDQPFTPPTSYIGDASPNPAPEGDSISFNGYGKDVDGFVVEYAWRSDIDGQLNTSNSFITSNLSVGTHTIYFKVRDDDGLWSTETAVTVTVVEKVAPTAIIDSIQPNPATEDETISFSGHGTDPDGSIVGYNWRSDKDGELSTSKTFSKSDLSVGSHTIYFKVKDDDGLWSIETEVTVTIEPVQLITTRMLYGIIGGLVIVITIIIVYFRRRK